MQNWIDGAQYWLTYTDGSRILTTARIDGLGDVDLVNGDMDFSLWTGRNNLDNIEVEDAK